MITKRDQDVLNFLEDFHIATSGQIQRLFFPNTYRYCMKKLSGLCEEGFVKHTVSTINNCRAYYIDHRPVQVHHDLIRAELYAELKRRYVIKDWLNEKTVDHTRPDALAYIEDHGIVFPVFIEIHLNNKFDFDKYKKLFGESDLKAMFGVMPRVLICTDRQINPPPGLLKYKVVNFNNMSGLENLLK
jgi:hypothetical protein